MLLIKVNPNVLTFLAFCYIIISILILMTNECVFTQPQRQVWIDRCLHQRQKPLPLQKPATSLSTMSFARGQSRQSARRWVSARQSPCRLQEFRITSSSGSFKHMSPMNGNVITIPIKEKATFSHCIKSPYHTLMKGRRKPLD